MHVHSARYLLHVVLQAAWHGEVHHRAQLLLVHSHAECDRGDHHARAAGAEGRLRVFFFVYRSWLIS